MSFTVVPTVSFPLLNVVVHLLLYCNSKVVMVKILTRTENLLWKFAIVLITSKIRCQDYPWKGSWNIPQVYQSLSRGARFGGPTTFWHAPAVGANRFNNLQKWLKVSHVNFQSSVWEEADEETKNPYNYHTSQFVRGSRTEEWHMTVRQWGISIL